MRTPFFSFILYKVGVTMERFVLQKYTFRFGLAIRFVLRIINLQQIYCMNKKSDNAS